MIELSLANGVLVGVLVLGSALLGLGVAKLARPGRESSQPGGRPSAAPRPSSPDGTPAARKEWRPNLRYFGGQMRAVMGASFERRQVMTRAEYRVFRIVEEDLAAARKGFRIFPQASLGQILDSPCRYAFRSINSKRVDMLVTDPYGWPVLAVEYQGDGHYQGDAPARDAVKKEALRKAGVHYVEVFEGDSEDQIRYRVREKLGWATGPTSG
jgi:hypothetical protein